MSTDWRALCAELTDALASTGEAASGTYDALVQRARAVLARYAHQPAPPVEGEVGELIEGLKLISDGMDVMGHESDSWFVARAVDLLSQRHPAPVPVAERPWERDGWCDEQGRCWWGSPCGYITGAAWSLRGVALRKTWETHCLSATALPIPAGEVE